jgi:hypothetical protein
LAFALLALERINRTASLRFEWHSTLIVHAILHLSRLVVHHLDPIRYLSGKLHELLVCWVLVHIVVTILGILELDYETVGGISLAFVSGLEVY